MIGSTFVARVAGIRQAAIVITDNTAASDTKVIGSIESTCTRIPFSALTQHETEDQLHNGESLNVAVRIVLLTA